MFFIISGALLYYNYEDIHDLGKYYLKRWKAIFPPYYLTHLCVLCGMVFIRRSFFEGKHIYNFVFTIIGMDGYLSKCIDTWYLIGEWFIGPIVILYLLYPYLVKLLKRYEIQTMAAVIILYILTLNFRMFNQNSFRNLFSCLLSFSTGIVIMKHDVFRYSKYIFVPCIISVFLCCFAPVIFEENISSHIIGTLMFFVLFTIGNYLEASEFFAKPILFISSQSYEIFLIQHIVIWFVTELFTPANAIELGVMLAAVYAMIIMISYVLNVINSIITGKVAVMLSDTRK